MEPSTILLVIMGLACPIGMGLMMWLMNKNMSQPSQHGSPDKEKGIGAVSRLAELREQRQSLETEIAELSQIAELEEQREGLLANPSSASEETTISATSR